LSFRPSRSAELGVSRTAQICGKGRPCGFGTFKDMLIGHDNSGDNVSEENEPGNQLGGFEGRFVSPWKHLPAAIYTQMIGEDEDTGLPSKYMALFGVETWKPLGSGALLRAVLEFSDTTCSWSTRQRYNCAYSQSIFNVEGYRYRGRSMGHAYDNDARVWSGALLYTQPNGVSWHLTVHNGRLNRRGPEPDFRNTVSPVSARYRAAKLEATGVYDRNHWTAGVGYEGVSPRVGNNRDNLRIYVRWWRDFDFGR
jgi:Capsule assembly protein Wzi